MDSPDSPPFKVTICGIDELVDYTGSGVSHVLSILDPDAPVPPAFLDFPDHARLELRFHDVIEEVVPGYDSPQPDHIRSLFAFGETMAREPEAVRHLLIHCHMGISRSTAAAVLLLAQARPGWPPAAIMAEVAQVRPKAWPNLRMIEMGDDFLKMRGELIRAVRTRHREMARALPHVATLMRESGRDRELE